MWSRRMRSAAAGWGCSLCTRRSSASWTWSASPPGWRLEEVEVRPGARPDGTAIGRIRAAHPEVRILAVTQRGADAAAFPAHEMTPGPGALGLLLAPAAAGHAAAGGPRRGQ